jgi:hypothetical protein
VGIADYLNQSYPDDLTLATGLSDRAGEAVLAVPGIGVSSNPNGGGAVTTSSRNRRKTAPAIADKMSEIADLLKQRTLRHAR